MNDSPYLDWKFVQSFGDDNSSDDDLVTAVDFDESGDYLAVGDKAGRICVFEGHDQKKSGRNAFFEYKFLTEFQSHEAEFDCLKSLEIEEKINMIQWLKRTSNNLFLLACNDKTVKLWKVHHRRMLPPLQPLTGSRLSSVNDIKLPRFSSSQISRQTTATRKRVFSNAHQYHINSISVNCDQQTFVSTDDLRINLWNIDVPSESFNIIDIKPNNLEELTEVIVASDFSPKDCNLLVYSTSRPSTRLIDLREAALCDQHSKVFDVERDAADNNFFSGIIESIADCKFSKDGRFILVRDYFSLRVWDINMERQPVLTIPIHDYLRDHLTELYENDCIFDKFECDSSYDSQSFITGSYNNNFVIYNDTLKQSVTIEALKDGPRRKAKVSTPAASPPPINQTNSSGSSPPPFSTPSSLSPALSIVPSAKTPIASLSTEPLPNVNTMDFAKKTLHVAWHPRQNVVAVAGLNKLYIYQAKPSKDKERERDRDRDRDSFGRSVTSSSPTRPGATPLKRTPSTSKSFAGLISGGEASALRRKV